MKRFFLVVFAVFLVCVMSVSVFAAEFSGSYRFIDSDGVESLVDVAYNTDTPSASYSSVVVDVYPGGMLYFPDGIGNNGSPFDPIAGLYVDGVCIATSGDVVNQFIIPRNAEYDQITIVWRTSRHSGLIPLVVYERVGSDFITSIGDAVVDVPVWMGQVLDFVFVSPLAVLFGVGIAISLILLVFVVFRRSAWGA